jgi:hypothetical protein
MSHLQNSNQQHQQHLLILHLPPKLQEITKGKLQQETTFHTPWETPYGRKLHWETIMLVQREITSRAIDE